MIIKKTRKKYNIISRKIIAVLAILFTATIFASCLRVYTHVKDMSSNAYPIDDEKYDVIGEGEAKSAAFNLLWFFPVTPQISYNEAVYNAISKAGGDNLIDIYTWHERQYWIVGTVNILYVKGKIIKYRE